MIKFQLQVGSDFNNLDAEEQKKRTKTFEFAGRAELGNFWWAVQNQGAWGWDFAKMIDTETGEILNSGSPEDLAKSELRKLDSLVA